MALKEGFDLYIIHIPSRNHLVYQPKHNSVELGISKAFNILKFIYSYLNLYIWFSFLRIQQLYFSEVRPFHTQQ